jgi:hypothetical protein
VTPQLGVRRHRPTSRGPLTDIQRAFAA